MNGCAAGSALTEFLHDFEGLVTDMVLNPFSIEFCRFRIDHKADQELQNNLVTFLALLGQLAPLVGQEDRTIGLALDIAVILQALDGIADRWRRNPQTCGQIARARLLLDLDQIRD